MPKGKSHFTGELATPIRIEPYSHPNVLGGTEFNEDSSKQEQAKAIGNIAIEKSTKTLLLFKHYKIDFLQPDAWMQLAYKLADDCVQGFKVEIGGNRSGRKNVWDMYKLILLWFAVQKHTKGKNGKNKQACRSLVKKQPWKDLLVVARGNGATSCTTGGHDASIATLYNRYLEACNSPLLRLVLNMCEHPALAMDKEKLLKDFHDSICQINDEVDVSKKEPRK